MATLSQYLDVDGYVLHVTSALPANYAEATSTLTLGSQDDSAVPGTFSDSGIARAYAVVDPVGETIVESGLIPAQPVQANFSWQVATFEDGPKIIPQGGGESYGNAPPWARRLRGLKRKFAGPVLNKVLEKALDRVEVRSLVKAHEVRTQAKRAMKPAAVVEKEAERAYASTFAAEVAKVVEAPEIVRAQLPDRTVGDLRQYLEVQRREASARVAQLLATRVANDDQAERAAWMANDEADAMQAFEVLFASLDDDDEDEDEDEEEAA